MKPTIYTLGYQLRDIDEYVAILVEARIDVLVDVRQVAWSHKRGFSKSAFEAALTKHGIEYVHAAFAGNPKDLRRKAASHEECLKLYTTHVRRRRSILTKFEELIEGYLVGRQRVCITCFERHPDDCHRGILATMWKQRSATRRVRHLAPQGAPRFLPA